MAVPPDPPHPARHGRRGGVCHFVTVSGVQERVSLTPVTAGLSAVYRGFREIAEVAQTPIKQGVFATVWVLADSFQDCRLSPLGYPSGRWRKEVKGRFHDFGKIADDPDAMAALERWLAMRGK